MAESDTEGWGGGSEEVAPIRRQRGHWRPVQTPAATVNLSSADGPGQRIGSGDATLPVRPKERVEVKRELGHDRKRLRLSRFEKLAIGPRREFDGNRGDESDSPSDASSDRPRQVTPPPGLSWQFGGQDLQPGSARGGVAATSGRVTTAESRAADVIPTVRPTTAAQARPANGPLPPDHPLKVHLAALQRERERRKLRWAGLIDSLGDEFRNPASHDRSLWLQEEQTADEAIAETMLQIKMAEAGLQLDPLAREPGRGSTGRASSRRRGRATPGSRRPPGGAQSAFKDDKGRGKSQHRGRRPSRTIPLHQRDAYGKLHPNFRTAKPNAPTKTPMRWDDSRKSDAVRSWLDQMGMAVPGEDGDEYADEESPPRDYRRYQQDAASVGGAAPSFMSLPDTEAMGMDSDVDADENDRRNEMNGDDIVGTQQIRGGISTRWIRDADGDGEHDREWEEAEAEREEERMFAAAEATREEERHRAAQALLGRWWNHGKPLVLRGRGPETRQVGHVDPGTEQEPAIKEEPESSDDAQSILVKGVNGHGVPAAARVQTSADQSRVIAEDTRLGEQSHRQAAPRSSVDRESRQQPDIKSEPVSDAPTFGLYDDIYGADDDIGHRIKSEDDSQVREEEEEGSFMEFEGSSEDDDAPLGHVSAFPEARPSQTNRGTTETGTPRMTIESGTLHSLDGIEAVDLSGSGPMHVHQHSTLGNRQPADGLAPGNRDLTGGAIGMASNTVSASLEPNNGSHPGAVESPRAASMLHTRIMMDRVRSELAAHRQTLLREMQRQSSAADPGPVVDAAHREEQHPLPASNAMATEPERRTRESGQGGGQIPQKRRRDPDGGAGEDGPFYLPSDMHRTGEQHPTGEQHGQEDDEDKEDDAVLDTELTWTTALDRLTASPPLLSPAPSSPLVDL